MSAGRPFAELRGPPIFRELEPNRVPCMGRFRNEATIIAGAAKVKQ